MSSPPTDYDSQIEYNVRRLRYLVVPALLVNIYYAVFLLCVGSYDFISHSEGTQFARPNVNIHFAIQGAIFVLLILAGLFRFLFFRGATGSFAMLATATALFILTICVPIYFWGGSHKSMFGPLLVTVSTLTVIVAKTPKVRIIFGVACGILFIYLSVPAELFLHFRLPAALAYREIFPNKNIVPGFSITGGHLYMVFQTFAAVVTIVIAYWLSWKHAQDRTIFGDDAKLHVLRVRASNQERSEMVQTSLKFAVDIKNKVLSGGGQIHSECVKKLDADLREHGQTMNTEDIWCAEWAPATDEIIGNTLRSLPETEAPSSATPEVQNEVNAIASAVLAKEKSSSSKGKKR